MSRELWAMAPVQPCIMDRPCTRLTGGVWHCPGCIGHGRRIIAEQAIELVVGTDQHGRPYAVDYQWEREPK